VKQNNHGRPERVLVPVLALENAQGALEAAISALEFFDIDEGVQRDCERNASRLGTLAHQKPYKLIHRAPKGHSIVPKPLLLEGAGAIEEGASEFEDARQYCSLAEDRKSLDSRSDRLRAVAARLRRHGR